MDILIIFLVGVFGGSFGTLIGGCSLLTIPVLIFLGLPPSVAIATNRLGLTGMSLVGWYSFHKQKKIDYRIGLIIGIPSMLGAIIGSNLVVTIDLQVLRWIIGGLSLLILGFLLIKPDLGIKSITSSKMITRGHYLIGGILSFFWGIYGGFYGAAFATGLNYLLILFYGKTFIESAATHKIAMVLLSLLSTGIFFYHQIIDLKLGITQFIGMSIGSYYGSKYADKIGNKWIRILFLFLGAIMAIKLLFP